MKNLKLHRLFKGELIKVFSLNAISTLIHMCTALVSTKVVASIIGPSGVALLGQLNNINAMLQGVAGGGIRSGVTKFIAEYKEDDHRIKSYISNALIISSVFTFIISLICILGHKFLSDTIMLSSDYGYVFVVLGFTIFLYTLNSLLISILNGFKEFKKYVVINISSSIFSLLFSITLCVLWGLKGAMISAVTFQSVVLFVTIYQCRKCTWFRKSYFFGSTDFKIIKEYLQYTLMSFVTLSVVPVTQMLLRGYVISEISIIEAGWWDGMNKISHLYLSIITASLSVYILPRMSELTDRWALKKEIIKCYKLIIPFMLVCTLILYSFRHFIIWVLYSPEFYSMENLFIWQLLGDLFKVTSWILSYLMLAKLKTKVFISSEIISGIGSLLIRFICVKHYGVVGLNIGYLITYVLYFLVMIWLFRDILFCKSTTINNKDNV